MKLRTSVKNKFKLAFILVAVGPLLTIGMIVGYLSFKTQLAQTFIYQREVNQLALIKVKNFFTSLEGPVKIIFYLKDMRLMTPAQHEELLSMIIHYNDPDFDNVFEEAALFDRSGKMLDWQVHHNAHAGGFLLKSRTAADVAATLSGTDVYYGSVSFNEITGEPFLTIGIPVLDPRGEKPWGGLLLKVRIREIWDIMNEIRIYPSGIVYIVDRKDQVVAHPDPSVVLRGTRFPVLHHEDGVHNGLSGKRAVIACERFTLGHHTYHIITEIPFEDAMSLTFNSFKILASIIFLTLAIAALIAFRIGRQVVIPLEILSQKALQIGEGDLNQRIELDREDEFGALARAFNAMSGQLQETVTSLEKQIVIQKEAEAALHRAKHEAEQANKSKSVFLANMSHELRTPLNAILGFSQFMARDPAMISGQKETLGIIIRSGNHLLNLINDILDMSKIEAGRITLNKQSMDLLRVVTEIEEMMRPRTREKGLSFNVQWAPDIPRHIRGDEAKLRQMLINLLGNALKFTDTGGVTLRIKTADETAFQVKTDRPPADFSSVSFYLFFEIEDTGAGISAEELPHLFEPFVQSRSGQKTGQGTGLGLAISRHFARVMGGDISVQSAAGRGSTFTFHIQAEPAAPDEVEIQVPSPRVIGLEPGQTDYRILIVEDNPDNLNLLSRLLESVGFQVRGAANGVEGIEIFENWHPHLIWMDMRMPVMNGYEAARRIKSTTAGQAVPVIAVTASAFEEQKNMVLSAGCDDFVRKPFHEPGIFDVMARHLGVRYIYEETEPAPPPLDGFLETRDFGTFPKLPDEWRSGMEQAIVNLDMERISYLIEHIRPQHPAAADIMTGMANNFKYDELNEIISRPRE